MKRNPLKHLQIGDLTPRQTAISIGLLLGDVSIQSQNHGRTHRLKFEQSSAHDAYMHHLHAEFQPWVLSLPRPCYRKNAANRDVVTVRMQTVGAKAFNFLNPLFPTVNGKKSLDVAKIRPYFNATSLAYWFMDDGGPLDYHAAGSKGLVFHTQGFTVAEVQALCVMLREMHLICWVKFNKRKPVLAISGHCYERLCALIQPNLIPSMRYKFPKPRVNSVDDIV